MKKLLIAAAAIAFATPALAATDGNLDTTSSTGNLNVSVAIPTLVRVSGLEDLHIAITPAMLTSPYFNHEDAQSVFCVYSNNGADGSYSMKVSGNAAGAGNTPWALSGSGGNLPYALYASDDAGHNNFNWTGPSTVHHYISNGDGNGRRTQTNCQDQGDNASLTFRVYTADVLAAQAGDYSDTITVTVSAT